MKEKPLVNKEKTDVSIRKTDEFSRFNINTGNILQSRYPNNTHNSRNRNVKHKNSYPHRFLTSYHIIVPKNGGNKLYNYFHYYIIGKEEAKTKFF